MRYLSRRIWSHNSENPKSKQTVNEIRKSAPRQVPTYRDLVRLVARILYYNRHQSLFFRGQAREHVDANSRASVLPSIYRGVKSRRVSRADLKLRFDQLGEAEALLAKRFERKELESDETFRNYHVVKWAILQHYQVCETPLLDVTTSLRAACSFALENPTETGVVYVLGLPHINGSISFYVEEELINLKLLGICPPCAVRPYFQEGYLVGSLPIDELTSYSSKLDFGRRLMAKFQIGGERFWDSDFAAIPEGALFPVGDDMAHICDEIRHQLGGPQLFV